MFQTTPDHLYKSRMLKFIKVLSSISIILLFLLLLNETHMHSKLCSEKRSLLNISILPLIWYVLWLNSTTYGFLLGRGKEEIDTLAI